MSECKCKILDECKISTFQQFKELKSIIEELLVSDYLKEVEVKKPYYVGIDGQGNEVKWFANKWYKCNKCGTIWEILFPDFPMTGNVRKIIE